MWRGSSYALWTINDHFTWPREPRVYRRTDRHADRQTDGRADMVIQVYPLTSLRGHNYLAKWLGGRAPCASPRLLCPCIFFFLCRLRSKAAHKDHSVCLSSSHTFWVVPHSYVSQAAHAFLGMLPLCSYLIFRLCWYGIFTAVVTEFLLPDFDLSGHLECRFRRLWHQRRTFGPHRLTRSQRFSAGTTGYT